MLVRRANLEYPEKILLQLKGLSLHPLKLDEAHFLFFSKPTPALEDIKQAAGV